MADFTLFSLHFWRKSFIFLQNFPCGALLFTFQPVFGKFFWLFFHKKPILWNNVLLTLCPIWCLAFLRTIVAWKRRFEKIHLVTLASERDLHTFTTFTTFMTFILVFILATGITGRDGRNYISNWLVGWALVGSQGSFRRSHAKYFCKYFFLQMLFFSVALLK